MLQQVLNTVSASGQKSIPVVEIEKSSVEKARLKNDPQWDKLTTIRAALTFDDVQLLHAMVKAAYLKPTDPVLPSISALINTQYVIDWSSNDLCLQENGHRVFQDFLQTSVIGSIGQGVSLLFAQKNGYAFASHLEQELKNAGVSMTDPHNRKLPVADFLCSGSAGRAIVESKARCKDKKNCPKKLKALLRPALIEQAQPWMNKIYPPAKKAFAVATYLRNNSDPSCDKSVVAFVDPEGDEPLEPGKELPEYQIRRANYAAWLRVMGLYESATRLYRAQGEHATHLFAVYDLNGREIAFPVGFPGQCVADFNIYRQPPFPLAGIELKPLKAIAEAARGEYEALEEFNPSNDSGLSVSNETSHYSIFPDGSFWGSPDHATFLNFIPVRI